MHAPKLLLLFGMALGIGIATFPFIALRMGMLQSYLTARQAAVTDPAKQLDGILGMVQPTMFLLALIPVGFGLVMICWQLLQMKDRRSKQPALPRTRL